MQFKPAAYRPLTVPNLGLREMQKIVMELYAYEPLNWPTSQQEGLAPSSLSFICSP